MWPFRRPKPVDPLLELWRQETAQDQRRLQPLLAAAVLINLFSRFAEFLAENENPVQGPISPPSGRRNGSAKRSIEPANARQRFRQFCLCLWRHPGNRLRRPAVRFLRWLAVRLVTAWFRLLLCLVKALRWFSGKVKTWPR